MYAAQNAEEEADPLPVRKISGILYEGNRAFKAVQRHDGA